MDHHVDRSCDSAGQHHHAVRAGFSSGTNPNKGNLCKAVLIFYLIGIVCFFLFGGLAFFSAMRGMPQPT